MHRASWLVALAVLAAGSAGAAISYNTPGSLYFENFNSLPSTGTSASWVDNSTLVGWYLVNSVGATPTTIGVNNGSSTTGSFYSYGSTGDSDRALGGLGSGGAYFGNPSSGAVAGYWGLQLLNNTGVTLNLFSLGYDVEQWRDANTSVQPLVVEWSIDPPNWLTGTWNAGTSTNSPQTSNAGALDGNLPANRVTGQGFSASSITWKPGQTLWIRFRELNDVGNDHGLAIDDFYLRAIPEPGTAGLMAAATGLLAALRRLRQTRRRAT